MPNVENNIMSTFTIGGKTYQVGSGGRFIVSATVDEEDHVVLNNTWQEIYDAAAAGKTVVLDTRPYFQNITYLMTVLFEDPNYVVTFYNLSAYATGPNDYPTVRGGSSR